MAYGIVLQLKHLSYSDVWKIDDYYFFIVLLIYK